MPVTFPARQLQERVNAFLQRKPPVRQGSRAVNVQMQLCMKKGRPCRPFLGAPAGYTLSESPLPRPGQELLAGRKGVHREVECEGSRKALDDEQEAHEADTWGEAANIAGRTDTERVDVDAPVISVKGYFTFSGRSGRLPNARESEAFDGRRSQPRA